jgi:hypothetical protein
MTSDRDASKVETAGTFAQTTVNQRTRPTSTPTRQRVQASKDDVLVVVVAEHVFALGRILRILRILCIGAFFRVNLF